MAAYMESSFTGEAARDRYYCDHSSHTLITGGASSRIPRALNITPSSEATPSGAKRSFANGMWAFAPQERVRCCFGDAVDLRPRRRRSAATSGRRRGTVSPFAGFAQAKRDVMSLAKDREPRLASRWTRSDWSCRFFTRARRCEPGQRCQIRADTGP